MSGMVRQAAVAGSWYPGTARELRALIKTMVDETATREHVIGYYAPHAGYVYSGPVVGAVVSRIKLKDTFIVMGPAHHASVNPFSIMTEGTWKTPLGDIEIDTELAREILSGSKYLKEDYLAHVEEHSIEMQLPFIQYFKPDFKLVPIVLASGLPDVYREIGHSIATAVKSIGRQTVIVASGDMTHYESQKSAQMKDTQAISAMLYLDADELLGRVDDLKISMCGSGTAAALICAARELGAKEGELISYRTSGDTTGDYSSVVGYAGLVFKGDTAESPLVKLARETVETYIKTGKAPSPENVPAEMKGKAGVFVSIHKGEALRGCIGTIQPQQTNIAEEIVNNAISSATDDPRFPPITPDELNDLSFSVDVLTEPEPVETKEQLNPKKYGAIVESGLRRGLLLPDLEGVDTVEHQIDICRAKAGIGPDEPVKLYRFEVKRHK